MSMGWPKCKHRSVPRHGARSKILQGLMVILFVVGLSPWWVNRVLRLLVTRLDTGQPVDAIVVVGRGTDYNQRRAAAAVDLWHQGRAPRIFMSGANDAPILVDLAKEMGVPDEYVSGEACAATTWENAFYTKRQMPVDPSSSANPKILLVTDGLHTGRTTLLYRNFGFEVIPHPVRLEFPQWRKHIIREFLAIMVYVKTKRLLPPRSEDYQRAEIMAEKRVVDWQCLDMEKAFIPHLR